MQSFDVIICGGGPAGSTCALSLANTGLTVAVIEKFGFPRDKICGDLVAAYVPKVLNTLNPKYKESIDSFHEGTLLNNCRIVAPNEKWIDFPFYENVLVSKRLDFDNFLHEQTSKEKNITFFLNHEVANVTIDRIKNEVIVTANNTLLRSKLIIGCDGAHSLTSKKLTNTKLDLEHHSAAIRAYYKNVIDVPDKTFELHFMKNIPGGYFWIFPLKDDLCNVGLGTLSSEISKHKINLKEEMKKIIETSPSISKRFKNAEIIGKIEGFGLPLGSRKVTISGNNFMLCGDAASLIDPFTGEGIGQAMISGRYAGWHAKKCFEENNFSEAFMKQYDKMVYDKLWKSHAKSYFVQKLLRNRNWLFNALINLAHRSRIIEKLLRKILQS